MVERCECRIIPWWMVFGNNGPNGPFDPDKHNCLFVLMFYFIQAMSPFLMEGVELLWRQIAVEYSSSPVTSNIAHMQPSQICHISHISGFYANLYPIFTLFKVIFFENKTSQLITFFWIKMCNKKITK